MKLDTLAQAFGVGGGKGDIDGSMVYDYYAVGHINELIDYCANDVAMTQAVYKRMTFQDVRLAARWPATQRIAETSPVSANNTHDHTKPKPSGVAPLFLGHPN